MLDSYYNNLKKKITANKINIAVIGLGYVGLPLAINIASNKFSVIGLDSNIKIINKLKSGKSHIKHIPDDLLKSNLKYLSFSNDYKKISKVNSVIICVPTPLNKNRQPDISSIKTAVKNIISNTKKGQHISLESTTYPGTTHEELILKFREHGYIDGKNIFISYSPEREDPGNKNFNSKNIPKLLGADNKKSLEISNLIYSQFIETIVKVSSTSVAETSKLLENVHRSVNIGLVNEMKILCDKLGIDIFEVINAAATKPFGFVPYYPGPGLGGHCIPIDPFYLSWKAKEFGVHTKFIELAGEINLGMPNFVMQKIITELNKIGKSVKKSKILLVGLSYKKNIDDIRESPSIIILEELINLKCHVNYHDNFIPKIKLKNGVFLRSIPLNKVNLKKYDATIILTDHSYLPFNLIKTESKLIIDTRGCFKVSNKNIIRA